MTMTNTDKQFNTIENMVDAFCIQCAEDILETDVCNTCKIRSFHDFCESRLCGNCNDREGDEIQFCGDVCGWDDVESDIDTI